MFVGRGLHYFRTTPAAFIMGHVLTSQIMNARISQDVHLQNMGGDRFFRCPGMDLGSADVSQGVAYVTSYTFAAMFLTWPDAEPFQPMSNYWNDP